MTDDDLLTLREIVLRGIINDDNARDLIAKLLYLQHLDRNSPTILHIDSPGGSVASGLAILDAIDLISPPVHTCCHSRALAMATIIAAHGAQGHRFAMPDSVLALFAPFVDEESVADESEVDKVLAIMSNRVARDTGRPVDEITRVIRAGRHFRAEQAIEFGLVDFMASCLRNIE